MSVSEASSSAIYLRLGRRRSRDWGKASETTTLL